MKTAKLKDIANLADGQIIGEIVATVKKVFPAKRGEGKYGPWSVQNIILTDETGECRASVWGSLMNDLEGQSVKFQSSAGKKGLSGLAVKFNSHQSENQIEIKDSCKITSLSVDNCDDYQAVKPAKPVFNEQSSKQIGVKDAKGQLFQFSQLYVECFKAAKWTKEDIKKQTGDDMSAEHFQALTSSLFISGQMNSLHKAFPVSAQKPVETKAPAVDEIPMEFESEEDEFKKETGW